VVSNLYGLSGRRILEALAEGETDPEKLADLGDDRLKCGGKRWSVPSRGAAVPGFGVDSAQQIVAEIGADAKAFPQPATWPRGSAPFREVILVRSGTTAPGLQRVTNICGGYSPRRRRPESEQRDVIFRTCSVGSSSNSATWRCPGHSQQAVPTGLENLHDRVNYVEQAAETNPQAKKRRAQTRLSGPAAVGAMGVIARHHPGVIFSRAALKSSGR